MSRNPTLPDCSAPPHVVVRALAERPGVVFFDSASESPGALSLVAAEPSLVIHGSDDAAWQALRQALQERHCSGPFTGFAAGWVEYDGAFCFGFYDHPLVYRHDGRGEGEWLSEVPPLAPGAVSGPRTPLTFCPVQTRQAYVAGVRRVQEYIAAGDIYQVNLTHRLVSPWDPANHAWSFYETLRRCSPAPYAAFLSLQGRTVLSSSPELFLKIDGRSICTRPIKGTRPRRSDAEADARSAAELISSAKEAAELVMITDLERNDLGQICEYGSVRVAELLKLERYRQVFHLVSTVEGVLRPAVDPVTALRACFPGGSITGAPKKRAREIIAELEPEPRGLYTGAIGYFGYNGQCQFNIAIRTVVIENGQAHFHVGAGIVADSKPEQEWQETLDKAAGILLAADEWGR